MTTEITNKKFQIPNHFLQFQYLMRRVLVLTCSLALLFSCKQKSAYSGDHLTREMMQKVILDINLAEAYSINAKDSLHRAGTKNVDSLSAFYKRIFDHYQITEQEFNTSLEWYKNHPEELDSVYAHIIPIANKLQAQLPLLATPQPPVPPQGLPAAQQPPRTPAPPTPHSATMHPHLPNGTPHPVPQRSAGNANSN
jgi:hypothetical protein